MTDVLVEDGLDRDAVESVLYGLVRAGYIVAHLEIEQVPLERSLADNRPEYTG